MKYKKEYKWGDLIVTIDGKEVEGLIPLTYDESKEPHNIKNNTKD